MTEIELALATLARDLTVNPSDATITIEIDQDPSDPSDVFNGSDDPEADEKLCAEINARLDGGDTWAWCEVRVHATLRGVKGSSSWLGGCCYASEKDFREAGDYFDDLKREAISSLRDQINYASLTTANEVFTLAEQVSMARLVYKRFGRDVAAAGNAWRRLMQNNSTNDAFMKLVNYDR